MVIEPIPTDGLTARMGSHDRTTGGIRVPIARIVLYPRAAEGLGDRALLRHGTGYGAWADATVQRPWINQVIGIPRTAGAAS